MPEPMLCSECGHTEFNHSLYPDKCRICSCKKFVSDELEPELKVCDQCEEEIDHGVLFITAQKTSGEIAADIAIYPFLAKDINPEYEIEQVFIHLKHLVS